MNRTYIMLSSQQSGTWLISNHIKNALEGARMERGQGGT